jgi:peptide deformylase
MTIVKILQYPDERLKRNGVPVTDFGKKTQQIVDDMFETHYAADNCAALAATQLDIENAPHITVIDFSPKKDQPLCLINAKIVNSEGVAIETEGCMSVGLGGEIHAKVKRAAKIKVSYQDRHGKEQELETEGFMAKCIQHELHHLEGKLYIDLLPSFKKNKIFKQLSKFKKT